MKYTDLKQITEAPGQGWLLIYYRDSVSFHPYHSLDEVKEEAGDRDILEIHLFDRNREYRAVVSRSPRFPDGMIEHIADFADNGNYVGLYGENLVLEPEFAHDNQLLRVIHHLTYNQDQMIEIDDYRMMVKEARR